MNRSLLIIICCISCSFNIGDTLDTYCNDRFDFCIQYPASFQKQPVPENNDGLIFLSKDKKTEIRAFGSLAVEDIDSLDDQWKMSTDGIKLSYKKVEKDWFIYSGTNKQGKIVYRKTRKIKIKYMGGDDTWVFQSLMITYPASQAKTYDPYCVTIAKSLR